MRENDPLGDLLDERAELEQRALEWADRWIAASKCDAKLALSIVRPISFYRDEVEAAREAARKGSPVGASAHDGA